MMDNWEFNKIADAVTRYYNNIVLQLRENEWTSMMDSWEFNKIAAAVLAALLVIFGSGQIFSISLDSHNKETAEVVGYKLPVEVASADSQDQDAPEKKGLDFANIALLMQTASIENGEADFRKCSACHTPNQGGKNGIGPNLWNIVNREIGSTADFNYSNAVAEKGGVWDYESLAQFLHKPKSWLKGTKMAFAGIKKEQDIASMLVYLRSLSDNPADLPVVQEAAASQDTEEAKDAEAQQQEVDAAEVVLPPNEVQPPGEVSSPGKSE